MLTTLWPAVALITAFALRRRPCATVLIYLSLWLAVPYVASYHVTGLSPNGAGSIPPIHAATQFILFAYVFALLTANRLAVTPRTRGLHLLFLLVSVSAFAQTMLAGVPHGMALLIDQVIGTTCAVYLTLRAADKGGESWERLAGRVCLVIATAAGLALLIRFGRISQPFLQDFEKTFWYPVLKNRAFGTLDHPLVLGLVCALAIPLAARLRHFIAELIVVLILVSAVLASQSRTALFLAAVGTFYLVTAATNSFGRRFSAGVVAFGGAAYLTTTPLFADAQARFSDDLGSAAARGAARDYFLTNSGQFLLQGTGSGSSYDFASQGRLITSLENGWIMYAVDYGIATTAALLVAVSVCAVHGFKNGHAAGISAALAVVGIASFSSIATDSAVLPVTGVIAAIAFRAHGVRENALRQRRRDQSPEHPPFADRGNLLADSQSSDSKRKY